MKLTKLVLCLAVILNACRPITRVKPAGAAPAEVLMSIDGDTRRFSATPLPGTRRLFTRCFAVPKTAVLSARMPSGQVRPLESSLGCVESLGLQVFVISGSPDSAFGSLRVDRPRSGARLTALGEERPEKMVIADAIRTPVGYIYAISGQILAQVGQSATSASGEPVGAFMDWQGKRCFAPFELLASLEPRPLAALGNEPDPSPTPAIRPALAMIQNPRAASQSHRQPTITIHIDAFLPSLGRLWKRTVLNTTSSRLFPRR